MKAKIICKPYDYTVWDEDGVKIGGSFTTIVAAGKFLIKMGYSQ